MHLLHLGRTMAVFRKKRLVDVRIVENGGKGDHMPEVRTNGSSLGGLRPRRVASSTGI